MNFHFNSSNQNRLNLLQQLQQIDKDLEKDRKLLAQKKRLQSEFYEDDSSKNNLNIADQIMNQLLKVNKSSVNTNNVNGQKNNNAYYPVEDKKDFDSRVNPNGINMYQNANNFNQANNQFNQLNNQFSNHYNNQQANNFNNYPQKDNGYEHQNRFINKREIQKEKLQNQQYNDNPFINKERSVKKSIEKFPVNPQPIVNERELQKLKLQQANDQTFLFGGEQIQREKSYERLKQIPEPQMYQNQRELEKLKLQDKLTNQYNQDPYRRALLPQNQQPPEKDISKNLAYENRYSNPFLKNEEIQKQKREEQQREYRKFLEEQKKIEEQRKKQEKQTIKQEKFAFNSYTPASNTTNESQKVNQIDNQKAKKSKKIDPNSGHPTYNYSDNQNYTSQSDLQYMKMKADELNEKYRKGRIHYDQYLQQIKKLAGFYKVNYKQFMDKKDLTQTGEDLPWIAEAKKKQQKNNQIKVIPTQQPKKQVSQNQKYQIYETEQKSNQKIPDVETSYKQQSYQNQYSPSKIQRTPDNDFYRNPNQQFYQNQYSYQPSSYTQNLPINMNMNPSGLIATSLIQPSQKQFELVVRMFQEIKNMSVDYRKSVENQKNFYQQTLMKMLQQHQKSSLNQQPKQIQHQNQSSQQPNSIKPQKKFNNFLESQNEISDQSVELIDKSLSGIVNKISFLRQQRDPSILIQNTNNKKSNKDKEITNFFRKPYKLKKFKKFTVVINHAQQQMQIENLSNFLSMKNGKETVKKLFEEDLLIMKKIQRQKQVNNLRNKIDQTKNYQATFNRKQENELKQYRPYTVTESNYKTQNIPNASKNSYEEYENYSRNLNAKERQIKSAHYNHRSYKKAENYEEFPLGAFIKKHISINQEEKNFPNFSDQSDIKVRSPVYYSPKLNSEILEQDEYQTQQKSKELLESQFYGDNSAHFEKSPKKSGSQQAKHEMKKKNYAYEQIRESQKKQLRLKSPEILRKQTESKERKSKLSVIKALEANNDIVAKYQSYNYQNSFKSPEVNKDEVDIKQYSSINSNIPQQQEQLRHYFSNVNNNSKKQQEQSAKYNSKFNSQQYIQDDIDQHNHQYEQSLQTVKSQRDSLIVDGKNKQSAKKAISPIKSSRRQESEIQYSQSYNSRRGPASINISQTIQSIEQSNSKLLKPPLSKKKSTSKKKESSITRTKFQKDSVIYKPPQSLEYFKNSSDNLNDLISKEKLQFDSNLYESQYDETVDAKELQKKIQNLQKDSTLNNRSKQPQISINPPVYITPKQSSNFFINNDNSSQRNSGFNIISGGNKLKSLQQARNLAKQSKKKASVLVPQDNYEEKMSELQSFLTKKEESFNLREGLLSKQAQNIKLGYKAASPVRKSNNKNIMNLLDDLQNDSIYHEDFESYREQSQHRR